MTKTHLKIIIAIVIYLLSFGGIGLYCVGPEIGHLTDLMTQTVKTEEEATQTRTQTAGLRAQIREMQESLKKPLAFNVRAVTPITQQFEIKSLLDLVLTEAKTAGLELMMVAPQDPAAGDDKKANGKKGKKKKGTEKETDGADKPTGDPKKLALLEPTTLGEFGAGMIAGAAAPTDGEAAEKPKKKKKKKKPAKDAAAKGKKGKGSDAEAETDEDAEAGAADAEKPGLTMTQAGFGFVFRGNYSSISAFLQLLGMMNELIEVKSFQLENESGENRENEAPKPIRKKGKKVAASATQASLASPMRPIKLTVSLVMYFRQEGAAVPVAMGDTGTQANNDTTENPVNGVGLNARRGKPKSAKAPAEPAA